ncbi:MAG TPA: PQQ-binding-like beta-propeller repeat protein [Chthoniobacteraceae bacterium]|jgi:outer membrane protein assembly factor BamB|nr:PQQ-binding-like beta-propeller repeat protein [Chthoniobacteraceae bacterium]
MISRSLLLAAALVISALPARAELPALAHGMTSFGAANVDGWVYLYGGNSGRAHEFNNECITGEFLRLQVPGGAAWETLKPGPRLLGAATAEYKGALYRVGGMEARNAKGAKDDLHSTTLVARYLPAHGVWEDLPPLPEPRSSHDVVVLGDTLYAAGGWWLGAPKNPDRRDGDWHTTLVKLDLAHPEKGWTTEPQPFQRRALAMAADGRRIWFLGGMDDKDALLLDVDWFEPATGQWGKGPALPDGTMQGFGMAACVVGGKLVASPVTGKLYALSAQGSEWQEVGKLNAPRYFHRLLPVSENSVFAVGGSGAKGHIVEPEIVTLGRSAPAKQAAADWPQWRGPARDGVSSETGWNKDWTAHPPAQLWSAQVGVGMSSPVVAEGEVVMFGNDGSGTDQVIAFDAATGKERWRHSYPCATAAHEMAIVPNGPGATPTIADGLVYTLSREGDLHCLNLADGKLIWRQELVRDLRGKRPVYGYTQSVLADAGRLYIDLGSEEKMFGSTVALDAKTGAVIWSSPGGGEAGYSAARMLERDGRRLLAMFKGGGMELLDPADGKTLWTYRTTARDFCNATTPAFIGHRILVSNTGDQPAALLDWNPAKPDEMHPVWENKQFALLFNSPIVLGDSVFAFNEKLRRDEFTCLDAATGEARWVSDAVKTGTFILADGHWIFLTRAGEVVLAPATKEGLKPIGRFQGVGGKCYATPTLAGGRLFVRNNAGELAVYDLSGR